ncbi:uncharacterized protein TNCV_3891881 [Trichonephila clavipes]|nr:uncharacterized protein TNCV_3891881 [Trichonephila clavipes]
MLRYNPTLRGKFLCSGVATKSKAHKPNRVLTFLTSLHAIGPSRTGHTFSSTKPGTASQGTFRSRYGMEESAQVPVPKMSREVDLSEVPPSPLSRAGVANPNDLAGYFGKTLQSHT